MTANLGMACVSCVLRVAASPCGSSKMFSPGIAVINFAFVALREANCHALRICQPTKPASVRTHRSAMTMIAATAKTGW